MGAFGCAHSGLLWSRGLYTGPSAPLDSLTQRTYSPSRTEGLASLGSHDPEIPATLRFEATEPGASLSCSLSSGELADFRYLTSGLLLDGTELAVFAIILSEGERGPAPRFSFGLLNQCQARVPMPLAAADQNPWLLQREGAWLKPSSRGDRVDLARVDRMQLALLRKGSSPVHFCLSPLQAPTQEPLRRDRLPARLTGRFSERVAPAILPATGCATRAAARARRALHAGGLP